MKNKPSGLITIFDFSVTNEELNKLYIFHSSRDEYFINTSKYTRLIDLAFLFKLRSDYENFKYFLDSAVEKVSEEFVF